MLDNVKEELNLRKETLNRHLAKFNQLKNEEKWTEAWSQLIITLNYANETLKFSAQLLKDISGKMPKLSEGVIDKPQNTSSDNVENLIDKAEMVDKNSKLYKNARNLINSITNRMSETKGDNSISKAKQSPGDAP